MSESEYKHLSHSVSNLVYHYVCPAKYRRSVFSEAVERSLREICEGIELRYEWIEFLEIGADNNHVHCLIQSNPTKSPGEIIRTVKSVTARRIFEEHPEVKKWLWGGEFWTDGYFVASVGRNTNEEVIAQYVREQGKQECGDYKQLYLKM